MPASAVELNPGTGGAQVGTHLVSGTDYQVVKTAFGDAETVTPVSGTNPMPVTAATLPLPAGAATGAKQDTAQVSLSLLVAATDALVTLAAAISAKTPALGAQVSSACSPVVLATNQPIISTVATCLGDIAHGTADSGAPVKGGGRGVAALPASVAANARVDSLHNRYGQQLVTQYPADDVKTVHKDEGDATSGFVRVIDPTSGTRLLILGITLTIGGTATGEGVLWFGGNAAVAYVKNTHKILELLRAIPSTTDAPGMTKQYPQPISAIAADDELHLNVTGWTSYDLVVHYVELPA